MYWIHGKMDKLLSVNNLSVDYGRPGNWSAAVRNVSFNISTGETLALVGKSGCGKSTIALALMGLLPEASSRISSGSIEFDGKDVTHLNHDQWRQIRGKRIAMIFQDPFSSLNPVLSINYQLQEAIQLDEGKSNPDRAQELLHHVKLSDAKRILGSYPHQLSGGQRQRVMIAMALARRPELLIADEPTTALDVTVQAEIIKLLSSLQKEMEMAMLFITHNMGLVRGFSQKMGVMFQGEIVEEGPTDQILNSPKHAYTQGLLKCIPKLEPSTGPIPVMDEKYMEG